MSSISVKQYDNVVRSQPGIRPEVVERARKLAADPNYPPMPVIRQIASRILEAPDFSEEES